MFLIKLGKAQSSIRSKNPNIIYILLGFAALLCMMCCSIWPINGEICAKFTLKSDVNGKRVQFYRFESKGAMNQAATKLEDTKAEYEEGDLNVFIIFLSVNINSSFTVGNWKEVPLTDCCHCCSKLHDCPNSRSIFNKKPKNEDSCCSALIYKNLVPKRLFS